MKTHIYYIEKLAEYYLQNIRKIAAYPTEATLKPVINNIIEKLKASAPSEFKAVKQVSRVDVQTNMDYTHVSVILDVDKNYAYDDYSNSRASLLEQEIDKLSSYFGGATFKVRVGEFPV